MLQVQPIPTNMESFPVDPTQLRRCLISGLFEETVEAGGQLRTFYTYLKPGLTYGQPCLVVAPPDGVPPLDYLAQSPWMALAQKHDLFLHMLVPQEGGWDLTGADADYMNRVYVHINSRSAYVVLQDNIYAVGVGRGATVAQQAVMKMSSEWSGLATFGDLDQAALLNADQTAASEDTGKTELVISAAKVPVPVWMSWTASTGANAQVCAYWQKLNDSDPEPYANRWADEIYLPRPVCKTSQVNEEKISQVRVTSRFDGLLREEFLEAVWAFLGQACRHRCFGTKALRRRIDPDAYGFTRHTLEWDGFTRVWYEYVPQRVKALGRPAPVVVCMHGRGGSAESFLSLSDLSRVAQERDFIAVFPEAGIYQQRPGGLRNVLLWNGSYEGRPIDDVGFVLAALEQVKSRWPVDETRIYACGQSSGGMMTTTLARKAPQVFAAVSPWSALVNPDQGLELPQAIQPAVPFFFLFGEQDWLCTDQGHGELEYQVTHEIAAFLRRLMELYGLSATPLQYTCGEVHYYVYPNQKQVPMLVVGRVRDMSHANYPAESWYAYDQFFSKFSKQKDGTLLYMGQPVT